MTLERGKKGRLLTGARARLTLNGKRIGYARNVTITESIEYTPVDVLDNIETEEFVPTAYRVTASASTFRVVGATLKSEGLFPPTGKDTSEHLSNILVSGDMNAQLEDTVTNKIVAQLEQVKVADQNVTVDARGITGTDVSFVAIRLKDESEMK